MKQLTLLNDNTNIKLGDTGTLIQFRASENDAPVFLTKEQSATFRIKNDLGFLKSIDAQTTMNGYVFEFDTSALSDLVVGSYQIELMITKTTDDVSIFPDKGFVEFNITENALSITGEQLPMMSLADFKKQIKLCVEDATQTLKSEFNTYVEDVKQGPQGVQGNPGKQGPIGPQGKPGIQGPAGKAGTITVGTVSTSSDKTGKVTNSGTVNDAILDFVLPIDPTASEKADKASTVAYSVLDQSNKNAVGLMAMQNMMANFQAMLVPQDLPNADLNKIQTPKIYNIKGTNVTNAPVPSLWGLLIVIALDTRTNGTDFSRYEC